MKARTATGIVKNKLDQMKIPYKKVRSETVSFEDLARDSKIFTRVTPERRLTPEEIAKLKSVQTKDFIITFEGPLYPFS